MNWRLAAFYIEKHRQFEGEVTINLGGEFFYQLEQLSEEDISIERKKNDAYIEGFFGNGISMISALVGSNGTGKTSLFVELMNNSEVLLVFENGQESVLMRNNYTSESTLRLLPINFERDNLSSIKKSALSIKSHLGYNIDSNSFHSPKFSYYNPQSATNYFLSAIATVDEEYRNPLELNALRLQRNLLMFSNQKLMKTIHQVYDNFPEYNSAIIYSNKLSNELLWSVELEISGLDKEETKTNDTRKVRLLELIDKGEYTEKVNFLNRFENKNNDLRYNAISKLYVMARVLAFSWLREKKTKERVKIEEPYLNSSDLEFSEISIRTWLIALRNRSTRFTNSDNLKRFIDQGLEWFSLVPLKEEIDLETLNILIDKRFLQKQQELNDLFFGSKDYVPFEIISRRIEFELTVLSPAYSLSQGEENLLNLLATLYVNEHLKENRPQILLLDEATAGFHPKWQKKLVDTLIQIVPLVFKAKISQIEDVDTIASEIQIIFTSHDPLTLSDIPNSNITYLKRCDKKVSLLSQGNSERPERSFGANISDLLAHTFYIDNGLVGDFSRNKINEVIDWLHSDNESKAQYYKKIIDIIDEPIVHKKLTEMYAEKMETEDLKRLMKDEYLRIASIFKNKFGEDI